MDQFGASPERERVTKQHMSQSLLNTKNPYCQKETRISPSVFQVNGCRCQNGGGLDNMSGLLREG